MERRADREGYRTRRQRERTEATGYGAVYFCQNMLAHRDDAIEGKSIVISGDGNVALHAAEGRRTGARVLTLEQFRRFCFFKDGLTREQIRAILLMSEQTGRVLEGYAAQAPGVEFYLRKPGSFCAT